VNKRGIRAYGCGEGDELLKVIFARDTQDILINTERGKSIRFPCESIRLTGRTAMGVKGINLQKEDAIAGITMVEDDAELRLLTITENGYGKRSPLKEYRVQSRNGMGVIDIKTTKRNGLVAGSLLVDDSDRVMLITERGIVIKISVSNIRDQSRNTLGVKLMRVPNRIVSVAKVIEEEEDSEENDVNPEEIENSEELESEEGNRNPPENE
jgi:DNA gyrase subunit A